MLICDGPQEVFMEVSGGNCLGSGDRRKVNVDGFKLGKLSSIGLFCGNIRLLLERVT